MFHKPIDLLAIGDLTTDAFIRLKEVDAHCRINENPPEICLPIGDKIPFEYTKIIKGTGNAANAAVCASRLGLKSALVSNIGNDQNGHDCLNELIHNKVITSYIKKHPKKVTNYHFVLWYGPERTILVNHVEYNYVLPKLPPVKWVYLTSMAAHTFPYQMAVIDYLEANPKTRLAFQPGTFQMRLGFAELKRIYDHTDVFVVNVEEAQRILNTDLRDIKILIRKIHEQGPKIVLITDGSKGAYMFDGDHYYFMPLYPDSKPPFERTGCGDAFSATFVSALAMGKSPLEALTWAPINPMSVAQFVGSQEGLLNREQIEWWLTKAPDDYKVKEI